MRIENKCQNRSIHVLELDSINPHIYWHIQNSISMSNHVNIQCNSYLLRHRPFTNQSVHVTFHTATWSDKMASGKISSLSSNSTLLIVVVQRKQTEKMSTNAAWNNKVSIKRWSIKRWDS